MPQPGRVYVSEDSTLRRPAAQRLRKEFFSSYAPVNE